MDFNKVIIAGRLTRDPEMKYLDSGNACLCDARRQAFGVWGMAINRYYNDNNGERQQEVCFVDVKAFGRQAEIVADYVTKGNPLFVEGRLSFYQYEDENGQRRNKLSVIAERVQLLPKVNGSISAGVAVSNFPEEPPMEESKEAAAPQEPQQAPPDDDVPF